MQTRDEVEGLHNCVEFSQPLSCLNQAMQTRKTFSIAQISTDTCPVIYDFTPKRRVSHNVRDFFLLKTIYSLKCSMTYLEVKATDLRTCLFVQRYIPTHSARHSSYDELRSANRVYQVSPSVYQLVIWERQKSSRLEFVMFK